MASITQFSMSWLRIACRTIKQKNGQCDECDKNKLDKPNDLCEDIKRFNPDSSDKIKLFRFYKKYAFRHVKSEEVRKLLMENPHVAQNTQAKIGEFKFSRMLKTDSPRLTYCQNESSFRSVIYWGRRKLLIMDIEFLTNYSEPGDTVVYVFSSPAVHISYLSTLFPHVKFHLYSARPFLINSSDSITLFNEEFCNDHASYYRKISSESKKSNGILFISDKRTVLSKSMDNPYLLEKIIEKDNRNQEKWHNIIQPKKSMLKFRLPWPVPCSSQSHHKNNDLNKKDTKSNKKDTKSWATRGGRYFTYLNGDIMLQPWCSGSSSETRLIVSPGAKQRKYDNVKYEEQMNFHNKHARVSCYNHTVVGEGIDHCYDCRAEIEILRNYMKKNGKIANIDDAIRKMSLKISRKIGKRKLNMSCI